MDLVSQNKMKNWLIAVLLAVNLISISAIWMLAGRDNYNAPGPAKAGKDDPARLLKEVLGLSDGQMKKLEELRAQKPDLMKKYNDSLAVLKKMIAEDLYSGKRDTEKVAEKAKAVGEIQARVEVLRYEHFNDLLALCTPEQKEKLKPILLEVFGRKPPQDELRGEPPNDEPRNGPRNRPPKDRKGEEGNKDKKPGRSEKPGPPGEPRDERGGPPDIDEKLAKYSERLSLNPEQEVKVKEILASSRQKGEKLRGIQNPDREIIEQEKLKIKNEEDAAIMKILEANQKIEFEKMLQKRRK